MSKHRAVQAPARQTPAKPPSQHRRARPGSPTHRAPGTPPQVRAVGRVIAAFLVIGGALPAVASVVSGHGATHARARAGMGPSTADAVQNVTPRSDQNGPPADRASRPSPTAALFSAAESLTTAAAESGGSWGSSSLGLASSAPGLTPSAFSATASAPPPTPPPPRLLAARTTPVPVVPSATEPGPKTTSPAAVSPVKTAKPPPPAAPYVPAAAGYPFSSSSVWRQSVTAASVASNSSTLVGTLASSVTSRYQGVAAFNVGDYNTTFYTVGASAPRADVSWDDCQGRGWEVDGLPDQFAQVPIPSNAVPADGTDAELTVYSPSSDQLWEFWQANHQADGWHACFGGRIDHVSSSPGYFSGGFGATATGLPVAGGMISIADAKAGVIPHAMSLEIVDPAPWNDFSYPAQRSDGGNNSASAIPEGTRFRLDPSINVNALDLTPLAKMIAKAAQQYGFIVTDQSGAVAVQTENAASAASDPWPGLMGGVPSYEILANFPWSQLQALPKNWGE